MADHFALHHEALDGLEKTLADPPAYVPFELLARRDATGGALTLNLGANGAVAATIAKNMAAPVAGLLFLGVLMAAAGASP